MSKVILSAISFGILMTSALSPSDAMAEMGRTYVVKSSTSTPRIDEKVSRDYRDDLGNVVRLMVTPPKGKKVDLRVLDEADFHIVAAADKETLEQLMGMQMPASKDALPRPGQAPVDTSDYTISMELVTASSCSVSGMYSSSNSSVGAGSITTFMSASSADMLTVTAYPLVRVS